MQRKGEVNLMKLIKITVIILILGVLIFPLLSCGSGPGEGVTSEQVATVQRGDLTIDITAVGNLAFSRVEDLAFEVAGTVEEVTVEEGDIVEEGQILAKLDPSEWEEQLSTLEDKVTTAERQLTAKERSLLQAEINLRNAKIALEQAQDIYNASEIEIAEADVEQAEANLEYALEGQANATSDTEAMWNRLVNLYSQTLASAEARLEAMLTGADTEEVAIKRLQVELTQGQMEDAQIAIEDAQKDLAEAKEDLAEVQSKSPVVTASFDGFITRVNVEGGDEVLTGTVAVQLADPEKFEADILVSEMDIFQVELGGDAWVQVDALSGLSLPAKIVHISPTATIQQGVVNYEVKVEIESLEALTQELQEAKQETAQKIEQGEFPERLQQALEEGRITQEQFEGLKERLQEGGIPFSPQGGQGSTLVLPDSGQTPAMLPEDFQLRQGLTVTVSVIVAERSNVLLVPNSSITTRGQQTFVQVLTAADTIEQRAVQTGISDYQFTEVTEGLSEGEQIVVPEGTATTTPSTSQPERPGMMIPGLGGGRK